MSKNKTQGMTPDETEGLYWGDHSAFDLHDLSGNDVKALLEKHKKDVQVEAPIIETQSLTMPNAVRVIVTYTVKIPYVQYGNLEANTMAVIDLPPNTTPNEASLEAVNMWNLLHQSYGEQFAEIANASMNATGWDKINEQNSNVRPMLVAIKTLWGSIKDLLARKQS